MTQMNDNYQIPVHAVGRKGFGGYLQVYHGPALKAFATDVERCFDLNSRELREGMTVPAVCELLSAYFPTLKDQENFSLDIRLHGSSEPLRLTISPNTDGKMVASRQLIAVAKGIDKPSLLEEGSVALLAWTIAMKAAGITYEKSYDAPTIAKMTPVILDPISLAHLASKSSVLKLAATKHLKNQLDDRDVVLKLAATEMLTDVKNNCLRLESLYRRDTCRYGIDYKVNDQLTLSGSTVHLKVETMLPAAAIGGFKGKRLCDVIDFPGLSAFDIKVKSASIEKVSHFQTGGPYVLSLETDAYAPRHQHAIDMRAHLC